MQQGSKSDVNGNLLQSFRNMDVTTGPAGTPRSTANTGNSELLSFAELAAKCAVLHVYVTSRFGMALWLAKRN